MFINLLIVASCMVSQSRGANVALCKCCTNRNLYIGANGILVYLVKRKGKRMDSRMVCV